MRSTSHSSSSRPLPQRLDPDGNGHDKPYEQATTTTPTPPPTPTPPVPRMPRRQPGAPTAFWRHFEQACAARNIEPFEVADRGGFSRSTITNWRHGGVPSDDMCAVVARVLVLPTKAIVMLWAETLTERDLRLITDPTTGTPYLALPGTAERLVVPASADAGDDDAVARAITAIARLPWADDIKWGLIAEIEAHAAAARALAERSTRQGPPPAPPTQATRASRHGKADKGDTPREDRPRRRWRR